MPSAMTWSAIALALTAVALGVAFVAWRRAGPSDSRSRLLTVGTMLSAGGGVVMLVPRVAGVQSESLLIMTAVVSLLLQMSSIVVILRMRRDAGSTPRRQ